MVRLMFETVVVTFGMFSALPMPRVDWTCGWPYAAC